MAGSVTTSLVVNFSLGDNDGILLAEIDDREDGLNKGNTSFIPGASAGFLIYKTSNVTYDTPILSAGSLQAAGSGTREVVNEFITFANSAKGTTRYPVTGNFSYTWMGTSGGAVELVEENVVTIASGEKAVGVLAVTYTTSFAQYLLKSPKTLGGLTEFPIVVFISGVAL